VTSATAQARPEPASGFSKARRAFRNWRRSRPFWGGLLVLLAGLPILYFPYANLDIGTLSLHLATSAGAASLLIGLLMIALGISSWFQPHIRIFAGLAALVLSLVSIPMSNLGGFGMGLLLGLLGGGLLCSWAPLKQPATAPMPELVFPPSDPAAGDADADAYAAESVAEGEEWDGESPVPGFGREPQAATEDAPTLIHPRAGEQPEPVVQRPSEEEQHHGE
jgi:Family of unknown function (DUF6114)